MMNRRVMFDWGSVRQLTAYGISLALAALFTFVCGAAAYAQQDTAALSGVVTDVQGRVVPSATVTLINSATNAERGAQTGDTGAYTFALIPPGTYTVRVESNGFKTSAQEGVRLLVRTPVTLDVQLEIGGVTETVTVSGGEAGINTRDATIGNTFTASQITQLPLEGRNVTALLSLQPGVVFIGENSPTQRNFLGENDPDPRSGSVGGGRSDQANVTLDGVDVNDQQTGFAFNSTLRITTEAVQEFRVTTTTPNADQGRSSGAQVNLVTKGGTNEFHGALFESHRNTVTTANDFFNNAAGLPRPKLLRNVFGAAVGGPVVKDRFFFFFSYEGRRDASQVPVLRTVPSDDLRNGFLNYRNRAGQVVTLTPGQVAALDPLRIGPNQAVLATFNQFPRANDATVGDRLNYSGFRFNSPVSVRFNTYNARFDYNLSSAHTLFGAAACRTTAAPTSNSFPTSRRASRASTTAKDLWSATRSRSARL